MKELTIQKLTNWYRQNKESTLTGRYITFEDIEPLIKKLPESFSYEKIGVSFHKTPIYKISIGTGKIRVLLWSQMHGNESTGTKALFDLLNFFKDPKNNVLLADTILSKCTLVIIPMLNPDGAKAYTRKNAQGIDLNRDAVSLDAPESLILNSVLHEFNPHFCFNMHDQRTIFSLGEANLPATISFLAPSEDEARTVTEGRKVTMSVIVTMNKVLQQILPNQIGRYTDEFYPTATGDNFQKKGHNTILIEAGHYKNDYNREEVRKFNFLALLIGLMHISYRKFDIYKPYFKIPNNKKHYLDIIYKNVFLSDSNQKVDIGIVFKENLKNGEIAFIPTIKYYKDLSDYNANSIIDMKSKVYKNIKDFEKFLKIINK